MTKTLATLASTVMAVVEPDTPALTVAQLMRKCHVGAMVVVDSAVGGRPVGIVTDRDLVLELMAEGLDPAVFTAGDVMTVDLVIASPEMDCAQAVQLMKQRGVRRLIVADEQNRLVGLVSMQDVLASMTQEFTDLINALERAHERETQERR
jgi:CBS domain-containing protein